MRGHVVPDHYPHVREKPGGRIFMNGTLNPGDPLVVFSKRDRYYRCLTPRYLGYVWAEFVQLDAKGGLDKLAARVTELEAEVKG